MSQGNNGDEEKKTVTIRGVDKKLYEMATETARKTGKTVGEVMNESLRFFFSASGRVGQVADETVSRIYGLKDSLVAGFKEAKGEVQVISNVDELVVTKDEIASLGKRVAFQNIRRLILHDLSDEDVENFIAYMINVDELVVPKNVNKLKLLSKGRMIKKVTVAQ